MKPWNARIDADDTSAILNPQSQHCELLKKIWDSEYEDNVWDEDVVFLERNSRDFVSRIDRINRNAEAICDVLKADSRGTEVSNNANEC